MPAGRCEINGAEIVLGNGRAAITGHHLRRNYDYQTIVGEVVAHPIVPTSWACSIAPTSPERVSAERRGSPCRPGRSVRVGACTEIDLGPARVVVLE